MSVSVEYYIEYQRRLLMAVIQAMCRFEKGKAFLTGSRALSWAMGRCCFAQSSIDIVITDHIDLVGLYSFCHRLMCILRVERMIPRKERVHAVMRNNTPGIFKIKLPYASVVNIDFPPDAISEVLCYFSLSICRIGHAFKFEYTKMYVPAAESLAAWLAIVEKKTGKGAPVEVRQMLLAQLSPLYTSSSHQWKCKTLYGKGFTFGQSNALEYYPTENRKKYEARGFSFERVAKKQKPK